MRNWIINIVLCIFLLARQLFPHLAQAHYFETAGGIYLTGLTVFIYFGILLLIVDPKQAFKNYTPKSLIQQWSIEIRDFMVALVAIYSSHYIVGVAYLFGSLLFRELLEQGAKNEQISGNVRIRRVRSR